jgi:hypothetical protein
MGGTGGMGYRVEGTLVQTLCHMSYTIHYTLCHMSYALYTIHYTLYTIHYTLYTIHYVMPYTLYTIPNPSPNPMSYVICHISYA